MATDLDHKAGFETFKEFIASDNLTPLCRECHKQKSELVDKIRTRQRKLTEIRFF